MTALANERVAYFNGQIVPESQVLVSFRDRSFKLGDAGFDVARTFGGKAFKLAEHVERLYRTLDYLAIDPGLSVQEMMRISEEVLERNSHLLSPDDDYWVAQRVTRGVDVVGGELWESGGPTVIVECTPLPLKARAKLFRDGVSVAFPTVRRVPPECLDPNAKTHNYLNLVLGDNEARAKDPEAWAILLDTRGFLCEGIGSNLFLVEDGALYTPKSEYVLAGVSRQTVIDLAGDLGIAVHEADLGPQEALAADEGFITSTSFCLCPVRSFEGQAVRDTAIPGPVTKAITERYVDLVEFDFVDQYLRQIT